MRLLAVLCFGFLAAAPRCALGCSTNEDCELLGVCISGRCNCSQVNISQQMCIFYSGVVWFEMLLLELVLLELLLVVDVEAEVDVHVAVKLAVRVGDVAGLSLPPLLTSRALHGVSPEGLYRRALWSARPPSSGFHDIEWYLALHLLPFLVGDLEVAQNLSDINLVWQCSDAGQVSTTTAALSPCSDGCINLFPCLIFFCDIQLGLVPVFFHARAQARRGRNKRAVPGRHRGGCLSSRAMRTTTTQSSTLAVGALRPKSPGRLLPSFHRQSPTGITRFRKRSPRQPRSTRT